ncbi:hypothetical protein CAPTEDRAFT_223515 [Capitella teleta]|uniref:Stanniocalcin n=1 Tax=Capitella teleta TaxID=283909 RepID=R7UM97_CAPTE|nr:hypothetical protein CAPTEDRAFT_223515 [Capitella teleta]|eukprot:ELU04392.1 hypothetical protein CAPTEDRAFT_223515 [Capitella teleta]
MEAVKLRTHAVLVLVLLMQVTEGMSSRVGGTEDQDPAPSIDDCSAHTGDCRYYTCLDQIGSCGKSTNFARSIGHKFCRGLEQYKSLMTEQGKQWAFNVKRCVTKRLSELPPSSCTDASRTTRHIFTSCAASEDLCTILWPNRSPLFLIFTEKHWLTLLESSRTCHRSLLTRFVFWTMNNSEIIYS